MASKLFCNDPVLAEKISGEFPLKTENVTSMIDMYEHLINIIPYQYLAHIIRTIEEYVRHYVQGADFFPFVYFYYNCKIVHGFALFCKMKITKILHLK